MIFWSITQSLNNRINFLLFNDLDDWFNNLLFIEKMKYDKHWLLGIQ